MTKKLREMKKYIKENIGEDEWGNFVSGNESCCVFHSIEWDRLLRKEYGFKVKRFFEVDDDGKIIAGGQFCVLKNRLVGLPFSDYYSLVTGDPPNETADSPGRAVTGDPPNETADSPRRAVTGDKMTNGMLNYLIELGKYKEIVIKSYVDDERFEKRQEGVIHFSKLDGDFGDASNRFADMHKRGVKKALKEGLIVKIDRSADGVKKFYDLHLMTRKRQGVPVQPFSFFRNLFDEVIEKGLGFTGLVYKDDVVVSGGVFLYFNKTFTYKFGASDNRYLDLRPNNLLFFDMIKYAVENGFKVFDFGKTDLKNEGLRKFKSGWGAEEKPLFYSYFPDYKENKLFEFAKNRIVAPVIKFSPKFVCRIIGEAFYKYSV